MRSDINLEGPAYVGKKSSRSAVFESTDEKKLEMKEVAVTDDDDDDDDDLHLVSYMSSSVCPLRLNCGQIIGSTKVREEVSEFISR